MTREYLYKVAKLRGFDFETIKELENSWRLAVDSIESSMRGAKTSNGGLDYE